MCFSYEAPSGYLRIPHSSLTFEKFLISMESLNRNPRKRSFASKYQRSILNGQFERVRILRCFLKFEALGLKPCLKRSPQ